MSAERRVALITGGAVRVGRAHRRGTVGAAWGAVEARLRPRRGLTRLREMIEVEGAQALRGVIAGAVSARRKRKSGLVPVMASGLGPVADVGLVEDVADVPADSPR